MDSIKEIINKEIEKIAKEPNVVSDCMPCYIITTLSSILNVSEEEAAAMLSNILSEDVSLNTRFIEVMEVVHMKLRNRALRFYNKSREEKDKYLELYIKNALIELNNEISSYGKEVTLRKLILNYLSHYIAQTLGLDLHPSTEELYYILRKEKKMEDLISELLAKLVR